MRIGVMTGGGDCPGLNAAIRAVTRAATDQYGFEVIGVLDGFEGLINNISRPLVPADVRGVLRVGGTLLGSSNRTNPFAYRDAAGRQTYDASERAFATTRQLGLDGLIVIGGDGTLLLANRFAEQYGVPVIGIPKTIDNDVHGTDYAIGFDSAVSYVTDAIDRLHTTAESHHRVMLLETMGRTTGWIALYAGVAGGADVILVPERPYSVEGVVKAIERRAGLGFRFTIIAVAEGVVAPTGEQHYRQRVGEPHEWKLGGVCDTLSAVLRNHVRQEVRGIVLGHLQRGGNPTAYDRTLATQLGTHAMRLLADGASSLVVGIRGLEIASAPLADVAAGARTLPIDHPLIQASQAIGVYIG
jgi:6-phosphofructokinase 1